jgi:hypothetical protein
VQVKRLVDRDRAQMLGNKVDILDKFETEFGDPSTSEPRPAPAAAPAAPAAAKAVSAAAPAAAAPAAAPAAPAPASAPSSSSSPSSSSAPPASPFAAAAPAAAAKPAAAVQTKFNAPGGGGAASPFGAATNPRQMRSMMEPRGLAPDMSPDPIVKLAPTPGNLLSKITLTQVVSQGGWPEAMPRAGCTAPPHTRAGSH